MKIYTKELITLSLQLFMFYIFPLFAGPTDAMGMVLLIILATFVLSLELGYTSTNRLRYAYPFIISLLFIPSVWIYYNESAMVHSLWYLVISTVGILAGTVIRLFTDRW